ncbi:MAG: GIY-YIG nuclease family protein, partial [Candidatus Saccharimonadales bacterium]
SGSARQRELASLGITMWYVYFLKSKVNSKWLYVGSTDNLRRRVKEHGFGFSAATKPYLPVGLAGYIAVPSEKQARNLEKYLKAGSGKTILKKRILGDEVEA